MIESDHSETEETNKIKLETVSDFDHKETIRKRSRIEDSEDEEELPTRKHQNSTIKQPEILTKNNMEVVSNKKDADVEREKHVICSESKQNTDEMFPSESDMDRENIQKQDNEQEDENEISLDKNDSIIDDKPKIKIEKEDTESKDNPIKKSVTNINTISFSKDEKIKKETSVLIEEKEVNQILDKESIKKIKTKKDRIINNLMDTEVVDGLELSVECASDKEELSSESENEANVKPRQKTIIVKVKPEESELECSSEEEKSNLQEIINMSKNKLEKKNIKRKATRINSSKIKTSESENSENNNSDEDYNPRTKKKIKRSMKKKYSTESKRGRNEGTKNSSKKNTEYVFDDENSDTTLTEKAIKIKNKTEENLLEKESSTSKSESKNSDDDEKFIKNTREKYSNNRSKDSKHIQTLKRYLSVAGIKVRSYNDIWADCKNNTAKIKRLKELLEKNGVSGRPTLEKCKRVKEKNEKMREISELDVSNIISEGRVTRARRNVDKKAIFPNTPPRHREARNTFKRIKTVVDSDSE